MKTSILVSGFAALCLLVTFAEAPRRHREDKMNVASKDNISIEIAKKAIVLPGVAITNNGNNDAWITVPANPAKDFSYLKFGATEYMETEANNQDVTEVLPEASEAEFRYLKFKIIDFQTDSEFNDDEMPELPVNENKASTISKQEPIVNDFEYLRFDSNDYTSASRADSNEIDELPLDEAKTVNPVQIRAPGETTDEFEYLKFEIIKFYSCENRRYNEILPE